MQPWPERSSKRPTRTMPSLNTRSRWPPDWTWISLILLGIATCAKDHSESSGSSRRFPQHSSRTVTRDVYKYPLWGVGGHLLPSFDRTVSRNVTTQLGQTGYLHCVVNNLGDKTVSWIRRSDFHVLTVGLDTYTSEDRFEAVHVQSANDWALKVKYVHLHDAGTYECQVSSDPKISFFVNLNVVVARASILGSPDLFVRKGSAINLTCVIAQSPEPPLFVFWYHDDRMINYDITKAEISVAKAGEDSAVSRLYISSADIADSGNYTCCPSNAEATSISVHVLHGEKPAAMQHDSVHISTAVALQHCNIFLFLMLVVANRVRW